MQKFIPDINAERLNKQPDKRKQNEQQKAFCAFGKPIFALINEYYRKRIIKQKPRYKARSRAERNPERACGVFV